MRLIFKKVFNRFAAGYTKSYLALTIFFFIVLATNSASGQQEMQHFFAYPQIRLDFNKDQITQNNFVSPLFMRQSSTNFPVLDKNGNLRFVATEIQIMNADYKSMKGFSNPSDQLQSVPMQIVPDAANPDKYYLFSWRVRDYSNPPVTDLFYHVVNAAGDNGKGELIERHVPLDIDISRTAAAIRHASKPNCHWLVTHKANTDSFYVYLLDETGLNRTPLKMKVGWAGSTETVTYSYMMFSPDGKFISATGNLKKKDYFGRDAYQEIMLFNFDAETGIISTRLKTSLPVDYQSATRTIFSPDSRLLYANVQYGSNGLQPYDFGGGNLYAFNTCFQDSADFTNYATHLGNFWGFQYIPVWGPHVYGPNRKLYALYGGIPFSGLASIEHPNRWGSSSQANFGIKQLNYNQYGVGYFLSAYGQKVVENTISRNIVYTGGCYPSPYQFRISNYLNGTIQWNFGDPASGLQNQSSLTTPSHQFTQPGTYEVTAVISNANNTSDTLTELIEVKDPKERLLKAYPKDTSICAGETILLKASGINHIFKWRYRLKNGSVTDMYTPFAIDSIRVDYNDTITVLVESLQSDCQSCRMYDSIRVNVKPKPYIELGNTRKICLGDSTLLWSYNPGATTKWSTGDTTSSLWVKKSGRYYVTAEYHNNGCATSDTVDIFVSDSPLNINLGSDTLICGKDSFLLRSPYTGMRYMNAWNQRVYADSLWVTQSGAYSLMVYDRDFGCSRTDTINIQFLAANTSILPNDTTICNSTSFRIFAGDGLQRYLWNTGETGSSIVVTKTGKYHVEIESGKCIIRDSIFVQFASTPPIELGPDQRICPGASVVINAGTPLARYYWSNGSTSSSITATSAGIYKLEGYSEEGCRGVDSVTVSLFDVRKPNLGNDTTGCSSEPILLDAFHPSFRQYKWHNGFTQPSLLATTSGRYSLTTTDENGCIAGDSIQVVLNPTPTFKLQAKTTLCTGESTIITSPIKGDSYLWNDGSTGPSLKITDGGNYWLRITTKGCNSYDTVNIRKIQTPIADLGADTTICEGRSLVLSTKETNVSVKWSNGQTTPSITATKPGIYFVELNRENCIGKDTIAVNLNLMPEIIIEKTFNLCEGQSLVLSPKGRFDRLIWNNSIIQDTLLVTRAGIVSVRAINQCGERQQNVEVTTMTCNINMPNAFTPNADGLNDVFRIKYYSLIKEIHFVVYDRWGNKVFESKDPSQGWDGMHKGLPCSIGSYAWKISVLFNNGDRQNLSGLVTLIR